MKPSKSVPSKTNKIIEHFMLGLLILGSGRISHKGSQRETVFAITPRREIIMTRIVLFPTISFNRFNLEGANKMEALSEHKT